MESRSESRGEMWQPPSVDYSHLLQEDIEPPWGSLHLKESSPKGLQL